MGQRIADTAMAVGIGPDGRLQIAASYGLAMEPRRALLTHDHDPDFLHPGRCAVILLDDLELTDPVLVSAVTLVESEMSSLAVPVERIDPVVGPDVARLVAAVPHSGVEDLAEALVMAEQDVRILALVERLDQLRHAHLWTDTERRRGAHAEAEGVYLPVAERTDATLARRYRWWCAMFAKTHLNA